MNEIQWFVISTRLWPLPVPELLRTRQRFGRPVGQPADLAAVAEEETSDEAVVVVVEEGNSRRQRSDIRYNPFMKTPLIHTE